MVDKQEGGTRCPLAETPGMPQVVEAMAGIPLMLEAILPMLEAMLQMLHVGLQAISEDTADLICEDAAGEAKDVGYAGGETPTGGGRLRVVK